VAHLADKNFAKLATAVAEDLVKQGIALNDTITKLATQMDMNDEQVARLCEATNNVTFNKLFQARGQDKTASDRLIEFDVADTKKVLNNLIKKADRGGALEKEAAYYEMRPLDDGMHGLRNPEPAAESFSKVAFVLRPESLPSKEKDSRTMRKTLDHLRHEKIAAEILYNDKLAELDKQFKRLYDATPFKEFEKSAAVVFGKSAEVHLNTLRRMRKMDDATYAIAVLTKNAGYIDDATPELTLFAELMDAANTSAKIASAMSKLEKSL